MSRLEYCIEEKGKGRDQPVVFSGKESKQAITDSGGEEGGGEAVNGLFGQHKVFLLDICKGTS